MLLILVILVVLIFYKFYNSKKTKKFITNKLENNNIFNIINTAKINKNLLNKNRFSNKNLYS